MPSQHHCIYEVFEHQKTALMLYLLTADAEKAQVLAASSRGLLIFARTRESVHALTTALKNAGVSAESLHGKQKLEVRERVFEDFRKQRFAVLVATEAVARGLDLAGVESVLHFDYPELRVDYLSRLDAVTESLVTFVTPQNREAFGLLIEELSQEIPALRAEGFAYAEREPKERTVRMKTPKKGERSKPLQNKKSKLRPKKFGR